MSTIRVLHLDAYRGRRQQRVERTLALLGPDPVRHRIGRVLARLLAAIGGDRAAVVWSDEFGVLRARPFVVLDLHAEDPRRAFDARILSEAWSCGVPGPVDVPELPRSMAPELPRSAACVALGSDGLRNWFTVVDSVAPREALPEDVRAELLYHAGEAAALVLHGDLVEAGEDGQEGPQGLTCLTVLTDLEGDADEAEGRVTERFMVLRFLRSLLEDELVPDPEGLPERLEGLRSHLEDAAERAIWDAVLEAVEQGDLAALAEAVLQAGLRAEALGELEGALESFRCAYWIAAHAGRGRSALDAARWLGRSLRRSGRWDESEVWYLQAVELGRSTGDEAGRAVAMDGQAATLRARGNLAGARRVLGEALDAAERSRDPYALGSVHGHLMTLHHLAGEGSDAVEHGWASIQSYGTTEDRVHSLVALAGIMLDLGAVDVAEEAYAIALERLADGYYRCFALEGYAHAAALRGDRAEYELRYRRVHAQGWAAGGIEFQAQAYVYRGRAYEALGDPAEATRWYGKAASFARRAGSKVHQLEAEEALARLETGAEGVARGPAPLALPVRTLETVRGGLGALRRELAGRAS